MTAAIVHLVNIVSPNSPISNEIAPIYLAECIDSLRTTAESFSIVNRYITVIIGLVEKWCINVPDKVQLAILKAQKYMKTQSCNSPKSGTQSDSVFLSGPIDVKREKFESADEIRRSSSTFERKQKHLDPESFHLEPSPTAGHDRTIENIYTQPQPEPQPQLFWTPFPENVDGMPVALQPEHNPNANQYMNITNMLDNGVDGDWAQLNRDGFMRADLRGYDGAIREIWGSNGTSR